MLDGCPTGLRVAKLSIRLVRMKIDENLPLMEDHNDFRESGSAYVCF